MSKVITRPLTDEQLRERERKQLQLENDLIIADLLAKIAKMEAERNDGDRTRNS